MLAVIIFITVCMTKEISWKHFVFCRINYVWCFVPSTSFSRKTIMRPPGTGLWADKRRKWKIKKHETCMKRPDGFHGDGRCGHIVMMRESLHHHQYHHMNIKAESFLLLYTYLRLSFHFPTPCSSWKAGSLPHICFMSPFSLFCKLFRMCGIVECFYQTPFTLFETEEFSVCLSCVYSYIRNWLRE